MSRRAATLLAGLGAAAVAACCPAAAQAATVELMVVGKERILRAPAAVRLTARTVSVAGRRCAAGTATPLSALAGARLPFAVRDYGSCGRAARDAGSLFVTRVGRERNRGRDGWAYKVGRKAGTTGAADPAGSFGTGRRLRDGDRVLWFWCELGSGDGCQRTLEVSPERTSTPAGQPLRVTVRGYDDAGRGVPVAGATVRLAGARAVSGADGVATVTAPATAGRAALTATADDAVRAFPRTVAVR